MRLSVYALFGCFSELLGIKWKCRSSSFARQQTRRVGGRTWNILTTHIFIATYAIQIFNGVMLYAVVCPQQPTTIRVRRHVHRLLCDRVLWIFQLKIFFGTFLNEPLLNMHEPRLAVCLHFLPSAELLWYFSVIDIGYVTHIISILKSGWWENEYRYSINGGWIKSITVVGFSNVAFNEFYP